jgi:DNA mismatch endonuclease (patch repair protein)
MCAQIKLVTTPARSALMSSIRSKNTKPEMRVRKALHRLGYRFRLHQPDLPGRPDIVLPKYRTIFEVKGCFWHNHACPGCSIPKTNKTYWLPKLIGNQRRDRSNERALRRLGWSVFAIWECKLHRYSDQALEHFLHSRLESTEGLR